MIRERTIDAMSELRVKPKKYEIPKRIVLKMRNQRLISAGTRILMSSAFQSSDGIRFKSENPALRAISTRKAG